MGFYKRDEMILTKILRAADHPYLMGKGGRMPNNDLRLMQGLSIKSLKHHVALQPLMAIMAVGMTFVAFYCGRLASRQPMSTGPRPRTLVTTWATTGPGSSNGSTPPARTTTRSPLTDLPVGSPSTTGINQEM